MLSVQEIILRILRIAGMMSFNESPNLLDVLARYWIYSFWVLDITIQILYNTFSLVSTVPLRCTNTVAKYV